MRELPIPSAAKDASTSLEIARVWAADGKQHVSLATGLWKDPAAWGLMLADLARHVANAYYELEGRPRDEVLSRIRTGLDAEWSHPTDRPTGSAS
jgi:uncharacterized protein DUF5076